MDRQQANMPPQVYEPYEDEIELMDLLKVLWKWKYLIIFGTLLCAVVAAVVSFSMTKVYRIDTLLSPGVASVDANGKVSYINSPQDIKSLIENGALVNAVLNKVKMPEGEGLTGDSFQVKQTKGSNALEVSYETPDVALGKEIVSALNEALFWKFDGIVKYFKEGYAIQIGASRNQISKVQEKIDTAKSDMESAKAEMMGKVSEIEAKIAAKQSEMAINESEKADSISRIHNEIGSKKSTALSNELRLAGQISEMDNKTATVKAQIQGHEKQIKNLENRILELQTEIERISKNTDLLLSERDKFLSGKKNENNILASVMYTNTIQQNIGYLNDLRSAVNSVNQQIYNENVIIETLENSIKDLEAKKKNLQQQTKIDNERLQSEINDLQIQVVNVEKQTLYKNNALKSDIDDYQAQIKTVSAQKDTRLKTFEAQIAALESEKAYIQEEIKNLQFKKNYVQNIQILKPPKSSLGPVKPKKKLNILLAGVVGLFLTVFAAFLIEYISKHKDD